MKTFKRISASLLLVTGGFCSIPAYAATTTYIVNTLAAGAADNNVGDGVCQTAAGECSLRAALQEANALPASPGDDIRIQFDPSLSGNIIHNGATQRMFGGNLGVRPDVLGVGAFLDVNAQRPITIDFDDRVGAIQKDDAAYAMFYIRSNDVVVEHFRNDAKRDVAGTGGYDDVAGIEGAEAAFVIGGSRVVIRKGITSDPGTSALETCVGILDGADNVLIEDYYCRSPYFHGVFVDANAQVSNLRINRFEIQGNQGYGDVTIWQGQGGTTTVNGLTITDSEFRSRRDQGLNYTINVGPNTAINDLVVNGSRFLGTNTPSFYVQPNTELGTVSIQNNTATNTRTFYNETTGITHVGPLTIKGNIITGMAGFGIMLQSAISNALIDGNQFLDPRDDVEGGETTIRVFPAAFGTNNVIRNNFFGAEKVLNDIEMIWIQASPGRDLPTGWSILKNAIVNIHSNTSPIYNEGDGITLISGNTFGEGTRGAAVGDMAPESSGSFFVFNADSYSNGKIQTWRPNGAVYTGSTVRVAVAPVTDLRPGNAAPTNPVSIDVYYTATDKAETYLGRIPGTHSAETVYEFTSTATGGAVRAQITDAAGRSSQYSAAQAVVQGLDGSADDDGDGLPNGAECLINLLGIPLVCKDSDGDGTPDYLDTDDDNDGIPTRVECPTGSPCIDTDGDGIPNHLDLDSDGDGITDAQECPAQICRDTDGDGVPNYIDTDSDGDGVEDAVECPNGVPCQDLDGNGIEDYLEPPAPIDVRTKGGGAFGHGLLLMLGGVALLRRRALPMLAGLLGLAIVTPTAHAAEDEGWMSRFYVGAQAGALFTSFDEGDLTRTLQAAGYQVEASSTDADKIGYGVWLGFALNHFLGLELAYTTGADERVRYAGQTIGDLQGVLDTAAPHLEGYGDTYLLRLRYHHALNDRWFLSPHVGVGMTQVRQSVHSGDRSASLEKDNFTWAVGGGLHYAVARDWSVGVGADYYQSSSDNAYSLVSAIVEWRFPRALPLVRHEVAPLLPLPVRVVPLDDFSAAAVGAALAIVSFDLDSAVLTAASRERLGRAVPQLREALQRDAASKLEIAGHTDASGSESHNATLSGARAMAVQAYLVDAGIEPARLSTVGHGFSQPRAPNDTVEGRSMNRRAELKLSGG